METTEILPDDRSIYTSELAVIQAREIPVEYKNIVTKWLDPQKDDQILEIGSGGGSMAKWLKPISPNTIASDINATAMQNKDLSVLEARAEELPFKDKVFDKTLSLHTLEHLNNIPTVLRELDRVTKAGGLSLHAFPSTWLIKEEGAWLDTYRLALSKIKDPNVLNLGKALIDSYLLARKVHPRKLTPQDLTDCFKGTNWTLEKQTVMYVPIEAGNAWVVLLRKNVEVQ